MKINNNKKRQTFGDFITVVYDACGQRMAGKVVRQVVNPHPVVFRRQLRFVIS